MRKIFIALASASAVFATPALADPAEKVTVSVQISDLDLATVAGQEVLDDRVDRAVDRACRSGGRDLASRRIEAQCRDALSEYFAPTVELAIMEAQEERLAAIDLEPAA